MTDVQTLQEIVRAKNRVRPVGASTKSKHSQSDVMPLAVRNLSGVIDYQPSEFIITAWAGTPIKHIQALLAERGQYLPFDPLLVARGATVGGTVAANASGPERYRFGGVRDFIIGCHFIDGNGQLLQGGGKVVKNAAGFDYPKLFVGSMGRLGLLVDVTFKVFPAPEAYATLRVPCATVQDALTLLPKLTNCPYDINAIDMTFDTRHIASVLIRVGGLAAGLSQRMDRLRALCNGGDVVSGDAEAALWYDAREFAWIDPNASVVKVPITPAKIAAFDATLGTMQRRYSVGGNVAWVAVSAQDQRALDMTLTSHALSGLVLLNTSDDPRIGMRTQNAFTSRVKHALDPQNTFGNI
jgi:glycolate oxidase FAD binding subunit